MSAKSLDEDWSKEFDYPAQVLKLPSAGGVLPHIEDDFSDDDTPEIQAAAINSHPVVDHDKVSMISFNSDRGDEKLYV